MPNTTNNTPKESSGKQNAKRGRRELTPKQRRFVKWFWGILLVPAAVVLLMLLLTAAGAFGKLPSFEDLENPKSNIATEVYSEDGKLVGSFYVQNRSYVDFEDLSPALVAALISTEDSRFYSHSGIDFISLLRVAVKTVAMGNHSQGGGSTVTQQLAKNLFPRDTTNYRSSVARKMHLVEAKFKEWITAVKLEYNYTKDEILAMYLNVVEFSENTYGIKSAAKTYFDKDPSELNVQESAILVGLVKAPTYYNPRRNPENAVKRRNTVMTRMKSAGYLNRHQLDSLVATPIELNYTPITHNDGLAPYFREMIRSVMTMQRPSRNQFANQWDYDQAVSQWDNNPLYGWCRKNRKADGTEYDIYRDGLKIYTTLNYTMQRYAEESLQKQMEENIQPQMEQQYRATKVLFRDTSRDEVEKIVQRAMRYSDRYRYLKKRGASQSEIDKEFNTPVETRIFTYGGEIDTLITPRDSILHHKRILRASFMAMDPTTGFVKAYVGGPNFRYFKYDMVKQGKRQVGSTIKPFVYTFAIDHLGMTPCTMVPNLPTTIESYTGEPWSPKEAGKVEYDGVLHPLRWGLAMSRNNYSAWIMKQAKQPEAVAAFIHNMGIHSYIDPVNALCLGTPDVSLFEMVGAYSTFVNKGVSTEPLFVTRIEDRQGNVLSTFIATSTVAISEQTAYTMTNMLKGVVQAGTANRLVYSYDCGGIDMGGKTGTSQECRDAWFMGITPKLVGGAWVGGEDQSVHLNVRAEGSVVALPIFGEFMKRVYANAALGVSKEDKFYVPLGAQDYNCPGSAGTQQTEESTDEDEFFR